MRILGIDFGEKRIGLAISDPLGITAQGVAVIGKGLSFDQDIAEINKVIKKYDGVDEIVVGLPKSLSGAEGQQAKRVLEFVAALKSKFKLKITTWDERLSTAAVTRTLIDAGLSRQKRKKVIDKQAATFILQGYLDRKGLG